MKPITIVDYGLGNIGSVRNMLRRIGEDSIVTDSPKGVASAARILLPGVGAFDAAMQRIGDLGLAEPLRDSASRRVPILGICLGMQLLLDASEEGVLPGLGIIPGTVTRFPRDLGLKVPHMGWNVVHPRGESPLTDNFDGETRFYFVHSYYVKTRDRADCIMTCDYGLEFDAGIQRGNVFGAQFHPEKSHRFGMSLFKAFAGLPC